MLGLLQLKQTLPIDMNKNMIQLQKKRFTNTNKLSIFARKQSSSLLAYLVHLIEKSEVCIVAMQRQTCAANCELNTTLALSNFY